MVAAHLPETPLIGGQELYSIEELRALPGVQMRRDDTNRSAVFARDRLAVAGIGDNHIGVQQFFVGIVSWARSLVSYISSHAYELLIMTKA
jgi:hypothetical protein